MTISLDTSNEILEPPGGYATSRKRKLSEFEEFSKPFHRVTPQLRIESGSLDESLHTFPKVAPWYASEANPTDDAILDAKYALETSEVFLTMHPSKEYIISRMEVDPNHLLRKKSIDRYLKKQKKDRLSRAEREDLKGLELREENFQKKLAAVQERLKEGRELAEYREWQKLQRRVNHTWRRWEEEEGANTFTLTSYFQQSKEPSCPSLSKTEEDRQQIAKSIPSFPGITEDDLEKLKSLNQSIERAYEAGELSPQLSQEKWESLQRLIQKYNQPITQANQQPLISPKPQGHSKAKYRPGKQHNSGPRKAQEDNLQKTQTQKVNQHKSQVEHQTSSLRKADDHCKANDRAKKQQKVRPSDGKEAEEDCPSTSKKQKVNQQDPPLKRQSPRLKKTEDRSESTQETKEQTVNQQGPIVEVQPPRSKIDDDRLNTNDRRKRQHKVGPCNTGDRQKETSKQTHASGHGAVKLGRVSKPSQQPRYPDNVAKARKTDASSAPVSNHMSGPWNYTPKPGKFMLRSYALALLDHKAGEYLKAVKSWRDPNCKKMSISEGSVKVKPSKTLGKYWLEQKKKDPPVGIGYKISAKVRADGLFTRAKSCVTFKDDSLTVGGKNNIFPRPSPKSINVPKKKKKKKVVKETMDVSRVQGSRITKKKSPLGGPALPTTFAPTAGEVYQKSNGRWVFEKP